jgi:hypothetical protein
MVENTVEPEQFKLGR